MHRPLPPPTPMCAKMALEKATTSVDLITVFQKSSSKEVPGQTQGGFWELVGDPHPPGLTPPTPVTLTCKPSATDHFNYPPPLCSAAFSFAAS